MKAKKPKIYTTKGYVDETFSKKFWLKPKALCVVIYGESNTWDNRSRYDG